MIRLILYMICMFAHHISAPLLCCPSSHSTVSSVLIGISSDAYRGLCSSGPIACVLLSSSLGTCVCCWNLNWYRCGCLLCAGGWSYLSMLHFHVLLQDRLGGIHLTAQWTFFLAVLLWTWPGHPSMRKYFVLFSCITRFEGGCTFMTFVWSWVKFTD